MSFEYCVNCHCNERRGVYKCNSCGKIFCTSCADNGWSDDLIACPDCHSKEPSYIGSIEGDNSEIGAYSECKNCGCNDRVGIYKCRDCNTFFCSSCAVDGWSDDLIKCPHCYAREPLYQGSVSPRYS